MGLIGSATVFAASDAAAELFFIVPPGVFFCLILKLSGYDCVLFFALFLKVGFRLWQNELLVLKRDGFPTRRVPVERRVCASLSADDVRAACANALAPVINAAPLLLSR